MRKFFFQLHLYIGLIAGLFLVLLGITGSIMAFEPELDHLLHHRLYYIAPARKTLSLAEMGTIVHQKFPGDTITAFTLAASPDLSWQVELQGKVVFVDPYTGTILGTLVRPDHWDNLLGSIHGLHLRLALTMAGNPGKKIITWATVGLLLLELTGLFLWWKQKRITIKWVGRSRRAWFDIHSSVGIVSYLFLFLLTITGLMIGFESQTKPFFYWVTNSQPAKEPDLRISTPAGRGILSPDTVEAVARKALPGALPFYIPLPRPGEAYMVRCRFPEDRTPGGRSSVLIDPYTGSVIYTRNSRTAPAGTRLVNLNRAIHTGDWWGIPTKVVMSLASLSVALLFISGLTMWCKRKG